MSATRVFASILFVLTIGFAWGMIVADYLINDRPVKDSPALSERPQPQPYFLPLEFASDVIYYCDEQGVPVWLACRLFDREAWFNPHPRPSSAGALGMGQFMPSNLEPFSKAYNDGVPIDLNDHRAVIRVAIRHLGDLYRRLGSWDRAVGAYNAGPNLNPHYWPDETVRYVRYIVEGR